MIPHTDWEPTPADIAWQENMLRVLRQDATWAVPVSQSVFVVDKAAMTFKLSVGDPNDETNRRIAVVFKRLGYTEDDRTKSRDLNLLPKEY